MKVPDEVVPLLELTCVVDVMAKLENEGSLVALEDVVMWIELISAVNATTEEVCEELGCELRLLDSAGLCCTVDDENAEKLADKMLVEENEKIDWDE